MCELGQFGISGAADVPKAKSQGFFVKHYDNQG
jgi:hypothetical protein